MGGFEDLKRTMGHFQALLFGVGGLIRIPPVTAAFRF